MKIIAKKRSNSEIYILLLSTKLGPIIMSEPSLDNIHYTTPTIDFTTLMAYNKYKFK